MHKQSGWDLTQHLNDEEEAEEEKKKKKEDEHEDEDEIAGVTSVNTNMKVQIDTVVHMATMHKN